MTRPASITVRTTKTGLHHWPDAPERRAYLRSLHRHVFHFEVDVDVEHSDRAVEFHDLLEDVERALAEFGTTYHPDSTLKVFGARSCEHLGRDLADVLRSIGYTPTRINVSEDGENDGTWYP